MSQNLIAAIEIGSQQVSAIIGRKEPDGVIKIEAAEQESSSKFIQRGRVFNPDLMSQCLRGMIDRLETRSRKAINQIYVGVGGIGLRSVLNQVTRNYGDATKITQEIVDSILDENLSLSIPGYSILDVLPLEYKLGVQSHTDPVGVVSNKVVGNFLDIIIPTASQEQMESSFRAVDMPIVETAVSPLRLANTLLTDAEKLSGCAFVDMGAETTTVGIFESKLLRFLAVLPLGGANVTRDLMTVLAIGEQEAEDIKRRHGKAFVEAVDTNTPVAHDNIRLQDGRSVPYDQVIGIIEARMSENIQNVAHLIKEVGGYTADRLIGGLIVTGGAANMSAVDKALMEYTHIRKLRFVKNSPLAVRPNPKLQNFNIDGTYNTVLAIIDSATEECCSDERKQPGIFDAQPTLEQIAEEERKRKEAEEAAAEKERRAEEERKVEEERKRKKSFSGFKTASSKFRSFLDHLFVEESDEDEDETNKK
ncbi:MAG: cell division protein FtsA [Bacteroidaceae bacterium]|nr:cell division protein FtsA [Bacteroidaceae bacterium]